ncbi:M48 family metallopeptidase [Patescibacteria group bacterium]|nr:M48 family metallopeptidase [Patescibacteria group bacterium]
MKFTTKINQLFSEIIFIQKSYNRESIRRGKEDYLKYKDKALKLAQERIQFYNIKYKFKYNKIRIRNQKTRWGSCSQKGNLNFNYRIIFLSEQMRDYIIVHELCHLKEFNHSKRFWKLVSSILPDYKKIRKDLKNNEMKLF